MNNSILKSASATLLASALVACGGGGGDQDDTSVGGAITPPAPGPTTPTIPKYSIGGKVSGLKGSLVLRNNGSEDLTLSADGSFAFAGRLERDKPYLVTIQVQPASQECTIAKGSGITASLDVADVSVACNALQAVELQAVAEVKAATLTWRSPGTATSFNVYMASTANCSIQNFAACPDGAMFAGVKSPFKIENLRNGQPYYFKVEATLSNGPSQLSNEAGARPNALAFNHIIEAAAFGADGTVYIGGDFWRVGVTSGSLVPFDTGTGEPQRPDFPIVSGSVNAVIPDGVGGWYLAGSFTKVGNQARQNLAHVLANGEVDPAIHVTTDATLTSLAVSGDTLYIGGLFTNINGTKRNRLAALGPDGSLRNWNPDASNTVQTLTISDGVVYVGGDFTGIGPEGNRVTRNRVAAIGIDGTLLTWDPNCDGHVDALAVSGNNVYVSGSFTKVGAGIARRRLAAFNKSGALLDWNPDADGRVQALAIAGDNVYAGGQFSQVGGKARGRLVQIDAGGVGTVRDEFHPEVQGLTFALVSLDDRVYVGGSFNSIDGIKRSNLAAITHDGRVLDWSPEPNDGVLALGIAGKTIAAGGGFTAIHGTPRNYLAALDSQGRLTDWNPNASFNVHALVVSGGIIYAGGDFSTVSGVSRKSLAAIGTDGSLLDWNPAADNSVRALLVSGSVVYAGGSFTAINTPQGNQARGRLAAISTDGILLPWSPNADGAVSALAMSGSTIFAGGEFTQMTPAQGPKTRNHLAAIDTAGQVLDSWNPDANGDVDTMTIAGNTIYIGGSFTTLGGGAHQRLAAIGTDGAVQDWKADANFRVRSVATAGDTVYAGGAFTSIGTKAGTTQRNRIAAISASGNLLPWNPDAANQVNMVAVSNGTVYAGGFFTTLQDLPRFFFGAVDASGTVVP